MKNDATGLPSLGWSAFATARYVPGGRHTYFDGTHEELLDRVRAGWSQRRPGQGREDLTKVVIVPVDPAGFVSSTVRVDESATLHAGFERRQAHEDGYVAVTAEGEREEVKFASVVLYSADTLLENGGRRTTEAAWEVVALIAGPVAVEPMDPLTMARNMLEKPGGTWCAYSAEEFAASIWYWAARAKAHVEEAD